MDNKIELNGIMLELNFSEVPYEISGRGWVHPARTVGKITRTGLQKLVGKAITGEPILDIESFAIENQSDKQIGILLSKKMW